MNAVPKIFVQLEVFFLFTAFCFAQANINPRDIKPHTVTEAEFGYLHGVSTNIQKQIDALLGSYTNFLATNTYIKVELDSVFTNWLSTNSPMSDVAWTNWLTTNTWVKFETDSIFTNWYATTGATATATAIWASNTALYASNAAVDMKGHTNFYQNGSLHTNGDNQMMADLNISNPDSGAPRGPGAGGSIHWNNQGTYIEGNSDISHTDGYFIDIGFGGIPHVSYYDGFIDYRGTVLSNGVIDASVSGCPSGAVATNNADYLGALLTNGTRAMGATLNMGGYSATNINTIFLNGPADTEEAPPPGFGNTGEIRWGTGTYIGGGTQTNYGNGTPFVEIGVDSGTRWVFGKTTFDLQDKSIINGTIASSVGLPAKILLTNGSASTLSGCPSGAVATNDARYLSAWQNPSDATNWMWTSDGDQITLTNYTGPNAVVVPDMLDGLPVTQLALSFPDSITSLTGGNNVLSMSSNLCFECGDLTSVELLQVTNVGSFAFYGASSLADVSLPRVQTVEANAFGYGTSLVSIELPEALTLGASSFYSCDALTSVILPKAQILHDSTFESCTALVTLKFPSMTNLVVRTFYECTSLRSIFWSCDAPACGNLAFGVISPNQVTNYVTTPTSVGWSNSIGGMPVVRLDVYGSASLMTGSPIGAVATNNANYLNVVTMATQADTTYWITNTTAFTNTIDFSVSGLAANKITLHDVRMFLSLTNGSPISKRATIGIFRNSNRRCDRMVYLDTNQLYYSALTTVAGVAGESSNVVADASGSVVNDLYYKAIDGTGTNDYQRVQSATATAIIWQCTNLFNSGVGTLISHVNQFGGFPYYDATGASSLWFRLTFASGYTGTVRTVINYGR